MAKSITKQNTIEIDGQHFELSGSKAGKGRYMEILMASKQQLDAMLSHHCKVLLLRMDLHLHDATIDNQCMSRFIRKFRRRALPKFAVLRFGFIWVREQQDASAQHYHLAVILDGNRVRHPYHIIKLIEDIWQRWGFPKPYTPPNCYYLIKRGEQGTYNDAFNRLSYMAKVDSKGERQGAVNDYSSSRLKPKC